MDDKALQLSNQVCFPIYSASRLITRAYKPYLDEMGITYPQYLVLMVLWESDNVSVNQITQKLLLILTTQVSVKKNGKIGCRESNRSIEDERIVIVQLTEKGKLLKGQAKPIPENLLKIMLNENINLSEILQLKEMLNQWIEILSENSKK